MKQWDRTAYDVLWQTICSPGMMIVEADKSNLLNVWLQLTLLHLYITYNFNYFIVVLLYTNLPTTFNFESRNPSTTLANPTINLSKVSNLSS